MNYPDEEIDWEDFDECDICGYDLGDRSSHYHCANCWAVASSVGHYSVPMGSTVGRFTCEKKPRP